jgi:hypothetical protein
MRPTYRRDLEAQEATEECEDLAQCTDEAERRRRLLAELRLTEKELRQ